MILQLPDVSLSTQFMYIPVLLFSSSILNLVSGSASCLVSFPTFSITLSSPTIPLFDWFYSWYYYVVTLSMGRNELLASHVALTQHQEIPLYPLALLTTNQRN